MVAVFGMPFATTHSCWVWWLSDGCSYKKIVWVCRLTVHFCWQWTVVGPFWGLSLITHVVPPLPVQSSSIDGYDYGKDLWSLHFQSHDKRGSCLLHIPGFKAAKAQVSNKEPFVAQLSLSDSTSPYFFTSTTTISPLSVECAKPWSCIILCHLL